MQKCGKWNGYRKLGGRGSKSLRELLLIVTEHFKDYHVGEEFTSDVLVMFCGMMLGPVVSVIVFSWPPVDVKLFLTFPIK